MPKERLVKEAVKVQFCMGLPGSIFMDTPTGLSFGQLENMAMDRDRWRSGLPGLAQRSLHDEQAEYERFHQQERQRRQ